MVDIIKNEMKEPRRKRTGYLSAKITGHLQPSSYAAERRGIRPVKESINAHVFVHDFDNIWFEFIELI